MLSDEMNLAGWVEELERLTREHEYPHWSSQVLIFEGQLKVDEEEHWGSHALAERA